MADYYKDIKNIKKINKAINPEDYSECPACGALLHYTQRRSTASARTTLYKYSYLFLKVFMFPYLCKKCYRNDIETVRKAERHERWEIAHKFDEAIENCEVHGTCGIIEAHREMVRDDPERLTTSFLIGLTCGMGGVRKYLKKRGDFTKSELDSMSDEDISEYLYYKEQF